MLILWNGKNWIGLSQQGGFVQGDAMSPYLFVLYMEKLGHIINQVVNAGKWKPIKLSKKAPHLSHLFFPNDLLLVAEAFEDQMTIIMECLDLFCASSSQKISF